MESYSNSYKEAGVDVTKGYEAVKLMKAHVERTRIPGVADEIGGFGGMFPGQSSGEAGTTSSDNSVDTDSANNNNRPSQDNMQMPEGNWDSGMNGMGNAASSSTNRIWLAVSVLILGVGLLIAKLYKH